MIEQQSLSQPYQMKFFASSFIANCISGLMHPLDLIKTRFQSNHCLKQVTTAKENLAISYPSTEAYSMLSKSYINRKDSKDSIKDFQYLYSVRPQPPLPFSYC